MPLFDFDTYFLGKWTFEWSMPESPLGPAGPYSGTTTVSKVDGRFYEAVTEGEGPSGPFKMRELIAYHKENKTIARQVTDSRGFSYLQFGPVGGDLGGIYNIHFDSAPFTVNGKSVRVRNAMQLALATQLSSGELNLGRWRAVHESRHALVAKDSVISMIVIS